jgi:hypothetical protein
MLITTLIGWVKSLAQDFSKPQTYGSALEAYIVRNEPKDAADVDRLMREFDTKMSGRCTGGFPC